ncbi:MAG: iron-containing alcohol dehydrogenase [Anaerolineae bacterium]|nr:iron-containing alcohol dehydrogenase [Anaerolineae bacterium]
MFNFTFHNPTKIVFGKGTISELGNLVPPGCKVLMTYGGGSIKRNGVYDQVMEALGACSVTEFGGVEPNPRYETLMKAVEQARAGEVDFLLAVGGGSVLDGTKFIAAAVPYRGGDPWDMVLDHALVTAAVPMGAVLTLPATGSEMNGTAVISHETLQDKRPLKSLLIYPQFSILDPETTYSLPERQVANGIVDTFVHVTEQYLTYDVNAPLQDRQAEAILSTLVEEAPKVKANPNTYDVRANLMWCSTQALNGLIVCGVPSDFATHLIGHELTVFFGLDHGQTLAILHPAVLQHQREHKAQKLIQYAQRVWGVRGLGDEETIDAAIAKTDEFFRSVGVPTKLSDYGIELAACKPIVERFKERGTKMGEHKNIGYREVEEILALCAG